MSCADHGRLEMAQWLIANGAEVNTQMSTGWTAMHAAAKMGHANIVELLLDNNGNPDLCARHKDFGVNLQVVDVATDPLVIAILKK